MYKNFLICFFLLAFFSGPGSAAPEEFSEGGSNPLYPDPVVSRLQLIFGDAQNNADPESLLPELDAILEDATLTNNQHREFWVHLILADLYLGNGRLLEAAKHSDKSIQMIELANDPMLQAVVRTIRSDIYREQGELKKSLEVIKQAYESARSSQDQAAIVDTLLSMSSVQQALGNTKDALENLLKAHDIIAVTQDDELLFEVLRSIGSAYAGLNELPQAIDYLQQASALLEVGNGSASRDKAEISLQIGSMLLGLDEFEKAKQELQEALRLSQLLNDTRMTAEVTIEIGSILQHEGKFSEAENAYLQALNTYKKRNDTRSIYETNQALARLALDQGQPSKALSFMQPPEEVLEGQIEDYELLDYHYFMAEIYKQNGDLEGYTHHIEKHIGYLTKLYLLAQENSVSQLENQLDIRNKENENKLLRAQNELEQLRLQQTQTEQKQLQLGLALVLVVCLVIGYGLYRQNHSRQRFQHMAMRDELCDISNRRAILAYAEQAFDTAKNSKSSYSIALIDLDHFKEVNDTYGHAIGDEVLKVFAKICRSCVRNNDKVGRFGGEEWLLVLPGSQVDNTGRIFDRIKAELHKTSILGLPPDYSITFSMGSAEINEGDTIFSQLLKRADANLYKAKNQGRDRYCA